MGTLAFISLGSNLGDRKAQLESALAALADARDVVVRAASSFHVTAPVGGPGGQGAFLNAAAALETSLEPTALLSLLQSIEHRAGRIRTVRWGVRPLDLDLLLFGDRRLDTSQGPGGEDVAVELIVPHPRMAVRRFVLAPLAEIAPDAVEPCTGRTVADLLANIDRRPTFIALHHRCPSRVPLFSRLVPRLSAIGLYYGEVPATGGPEAGNWYDRRHRELRAENWPAATWGDRLLVTDVWFDDRSREGPPPPRAPSRSEDEFPEARGRMIAPTFVIAPRVWGSPPPRSVSPTLRLESDDVEAMVEEISSACQASRAGRAPSSYASFGESRSWPRATVERRNPRGKGTTRP